MKQSKYTPPNCPVTNKKSFVSKNKARLILSLQKKSGMDTKKFYKCPHCKLFHLTSSL